MSFTVFDSTITCPKCGTEEAVGLYVLGNRCRGPGADYLEVADSGHAPCVECGYTLTADEEARLAEEKLDTWEPPSADDIADMKGGW